MTRVMAIDLGISNIKAGIVDGRGHISHFARHYLAEGADMGVVSEALVELCRKVLGEAGLAVSELDAVGAALPGVVHPKEGVIIATSAPGWEGLDVREPLQRSFDRPVTVEGEGAAAVRASTTFGPTRGQNGLLALSIGTHLACGFLCDGHLMRGTGHAALLLSHLPLFGEELLCPCGSTGCFEAAVGGAALRRRLQALRNQGLDAPELPEELAELAHAGDEIAVQIFDEQGSLLGRGVAVLLDLLNPRTIVLCGGFANAWPLFKHTLLKTARERAQPPNRSVAIVCAPDPERTALLGAAIAAAEEQGLEDFLVPDREDAESPP